MVCSAIPVIVCTIAPICSDLAAELADRRADGLRGLADRLHRRGGLLGGADALLGGPSARSGAHRGRRLRILRRLYLFAAGSDEGQESVEVDTHAWLEALLPGRTAASRVWVGADPTNRVLAGETHVKIGHGRHYADVPPIKGVYRGAASAKLQASVTMTRLERHRPRLDRPLLSAQNVVGPGVCRAPV